MASHDQYNRASEGARGRAANEEKTGQGTTTDTMKQKAWEAKEKLQQRTNEIKDKAAETTEQGTEKVKNIAQSTVDAVKETLGMNHPDDEDADGTARYRARTSRG